MSEGLKAFFLVVGGILLFVLLVVNPLIAIGAAFDAGLLTGKFLAVRVVLLLLAKPVIGIWNGVMTHE